MGGLAPATHDAIDILDAAGFDWVLVETVGVGQDEVDIVRSVESVVVVTLPGLGDDIQAIKAGLMEIADIFVINKADRDGVDRTRQDLETMISMAENVAWRPPIAKTVASRGEGIEEVLGQIRKHREWLVESGEIRVRRRTHLRLRLENLLEEMVLRSAEDVGGLEGWVDSGLNDGADPYFLAERMFAKILSARRISNHALVDGIDHFGIAVTSISEAKRFYEGLGLEVEEIEEVPREGVRVAMIPLGDTRLELLEPTRDDSPVAKFLNKRGEGMHHLCFSTRDIGAAAGRLRSAGASLLGEKPFRGAGGCQVQFVHPKSASGVLVELSQAGTEDGDAGETSE
jgi:LAO/AO transport system kinase